MTGPRYPELEAQLIGKIVRVYTEGAVLTCDHEPDRINIELDKETRTVKKVWLG